jgi:hypothetical protein
MARSALSTESDEDRQSGQSAEDIVPLLAEEVAVAKRVVETGRVQVTRITHEREQLIDELLARVTAEATRACRRDAHR